MAASATAFEGRSTARAGDDLYVSGCSVTSSSKDGLELLVKKWCRTLKDLDIGNTTDNKTVDWAVMALVENEEYLRLRYRITEREPSINECFLIPGN